MEALYAWVRNITFYMILVSVITNLLPGKKYEKYLRLFLGMVLILLVIQPLTESLRLEERIAYFFSSINFQNQAEDLQKEFMGAEQTRLDQMVAQYEQAVAMDLEQMAQDAGFFPRSCQASIGRDPQREDFGRVTGIRMTISASGEPYTEDPPLTDIRPVEPVEIGPDSRMDRADPSGPEGGHSETDSDTGSASFGPSMDYGDPETQSSLRALRRKIGEYYNLEEAYVEIQMENG